MESQLEMGLVDTQCKRERFKLHEGMRQPFEKDDELTTLRSRGSRVEHNFCMLSIFTASTITLSSPQCQIHNHRAQNCQKNERDREIQERLQNDNPERMQISIILTIQPCVSRELKGRKESSVLYGLLHYPY